MTRQILTKKGPVACLLIHGFTGSPNELRELGDFLAAENFTVAIPTLPGHGTYSADLFNYTWRDWYDCVKDAYQQLCGSCEEVFVAGLSMGGTLALHLAAHVPLPGVIAMAAAVEFPEWRKHLVKPLKKIVKYRYKHTGEDVKDVTAKPQLGSYRRFPLQAAEELFRLSDHVRDDLPEITAPILILHAREDHTVPFSNAELIFKTVSSADKRKVVLENSYHIITVDYDKERVKKEVLDFIRSRSRALQVGGPRKSKRRGATTANDA